VFQACFPYFCFMAKVKVKIKNTSTNPLPLYATEGSAGMDIMADTKEPMTIRPFERILIATGLFIELPKGYEAQVRPRSGLAARHGITCLNSPGTIDSDYRGEVKVILINLSQDNHIIQHGDRVAQMVVHKVENVKWKTADHINSTKRNEGGFGHTGK
jgi:dUTP pyrophosphatase